MNINQPPIAVGRTAGIYPYENEKEIDTGRYIQDTPLSVPKVYERIKIEDRDGAVYEKIEGPSL